MGGEDDSSGCKVHVEETLSEDEVCKKRDAALKDILKTRRVPEGNAVLRLALIVFVRDKFS